MHDPKTINDWQHVIAPRLAAAEITGDRVINQTSLDGTLDLPALAAYGLHLGHETGFYGRDLTIAVACTHPVNPNSFVTLTHLPVQS